MYILEEYWVWAQIFILNVYYIVHILIAHMWWWTAVGHVFVVLHYICTTVHIVCTVFPDIVSAETILFLIWKLQKIQIAVANFIFYLINWIFTEETIQEWKLYEEIRYMNDKPSKCWYKQLPRVAQGRQITLLL